MTDTELILRAALEYAQRGWCVLPLATRDKIPRIKEWQVNASTDAAQIESWWAKWPTANLGVQLGQRSGIIDIECDDDDAERNLLRLFDDDPLVTSTYTGLRGKHRIFLWRSDLPGGAVIHLGGIEVRTGNADKGAQSVFPPSIHPSGRPYRWLVPPSEVEPVDLPQNVLAKLWNLAGETNIKTEPTAKSMDEWKRILSGVSKGTRNQDMAALIGRHLRQTISLDDEKGLEIILESIEAVNERNQPPMERAELMRIFTSILKREQQRRTGEDAAAVVHTPIEQQVEAKKAPGDWRLVIVRSDPPLYELHASQFAAAENGCLKLNAEQMNNSKTIRVESLKQAEHPLRPEFDKAWKKKDGLYERLVLHAEYKDAPAETKRYVVVAERLAEAIAKPYQPTKDGDREVDRNGRPSRLSDGSIVFKFTALWEDLSYSQDRVTRAELSAILQRIGAVDYTSARLKRVRPAALKRLSDLLGARTPDEVLNEHSE